MPAQKSDDFRVRRRLTLYACVTAVTVAVFVAGCILTVMYASFRSQDRTNVINGARGVALLIRDTGKELERACACLAKERSLVSEINDGKSVSLRGSLAALLETTPADSITAVDDNGRVIASTTDIAPGEDLTSQSVVKRALGGSSAISADHGMSVKLAVLAAVPVVSGGRTAGCLVLSKSLSRDAFVDGAKERLGTEFTLYAGKGCVTTTITRNGIRIADAQSSSVTFVIPDQIYETLSAEKNTDTTETIGNEQFCSAYTPVTDIDGKIIGAVSSSVSIDHAKAMVIRMSVVAAGVTAVILLIAILFMSFATRRLMDPVLEVNRSFRGIAEGAWNLKSTLAVRKRSATAGLTESFNMFVQTIRNVVTGVSERSHELASSAQDMRQTLSSFSDSIQHESASVEEISSSVEQLASGMDLIAGKAAASHEAVKELTDGIDSLSRMILRSLEAIRAVSATAKSTADEAKNGQTLITGMSGSFATVNESSTRMMGIIDIINDIADRINLLSLNAAIEAARAGESGRGFAVVADEISKLADLTAKSIADIEKLIRANVNELSSGMGGVNDTVKTLEGIMAGVREMYGTLDRAREEMSGEEIRMGEISSRAKEVETNAESISRSTEEHKNALSEISRAIQEIRTLSQNNAASCEELAATASEAETIAKDLRGRVSFFKSE